MHGCAPGCTAGGSESVVRGWGTGGVTIALLLIMAALAAGLCGAVGNEAIPSIEKIEFSGNRHIPDGAIRGAMRLQQPVLWNPFRNTPYAGPDFLTQDLYRIVQLYRDHGYPLAAIEKAEVRYNKKEDRVRIAIEIAEGPLIPVRKISIVGCDPSLVRRVREKIDASPGNPLHRGKLDASRGAVLAVLGESGYIAAGVYNDGTLQGDSAHVVFRIRQGPQYRMRAVVVDSAGGILGATKRKVILREVTLKPGTVFRASQIVNTQERILKTQIFRTVRVTAAPDSTGLPYADVRITAHTRNSGWYGFGAGYSSNSQVDLTGEWGNRNIAGVARSLTATAEGDFSLLREFGGSGLPLKSVLGRISYTEPWIFGTRITSATNLSHKYERQPGLRFNQDITDLSESIRRSLGRWSTGEVTLHNEWIRSSDPTILQTKYLTRKLSSTIDEDRRDNILDPKRGSYSQVFSEYAGGALGGRYQFGGWTVLYSWYIPIQRKVTFAARAKGGWIVPIGGRASADSLPAIRIPFEERFLLGGGTTVRGYQENSLGRMRNGDAIGGVAMFLGNVEMRFPIVSIVSGAAFLDAGNVWGDRHEISIKGFRDGLRSGQHDPMNVAYGFGGGLRINTPVGPFRLDYGTKLGSGRAEGESRGQLHLSLGQAF
jgi:outer membrane protein insertion porin family